LAVSPITDVERFAPERFQFDIAMGVRKGDHALRDQLNQFISGHRDQITALLTSYGVPLVVKQRSASKGN
jgi:mxaJ protein